MAKDPKRPSTGNGGDAAAYTIGFGKPPVASRFKKGASGNPGGSSAKARARKMDESSSPLDQIILDAVDRKIPINDNGVRSEISAYRAAALKLSIDAAKGDRAAQRMLFGLAHDARERHSHDRMTRFELLAQYVNANGNARNAPLVQGSAGCWPHPDDVILNYAKGRGEVVGPIDNRQAAPCFALIEDHHLWHARFSELRGMAEHVVGSMRRLYEKVLGVIAVLLDTIRSGLPPSFVAHLDDSNGVGPAEALNVEGLNGNVNFALLTPTGDEMACVLAQLVRDAISVSDSVARRTKFDIAANTLGLINRLKIEQQSRNRGMASGPSLLDLDQLYDTINE